MPTRNGSGYFSDSSLNEWVTSRKSDPNIFRDGPDRRDEGPKIFRDGPDRRDEGPPQRRNPEGNSYPSTRDAGDIYSLKSERFTEQNLNDLANNFFGMARLKNTPKAEVKQFDLDGEIGKLNKIDDASTAATKEWRANPSDANRSELDRSIDRMVTAVANFEKALAELKNPDKNSLKSDLVRLSPAEASTLSLSNARGMTGDQIRATQKAAYGPRGYALQLHDTGYRTKYPDEYGQTFDSHLIGEKNSKTVQKLAAQALVELSKKPTDTTTNQQVENFVNDYVSNASKGRFKSVSWNRKSYPD